MGFNLYDFNSNEELNELQQNINISYESYVVIKNDSSEFSNEIDDFSFSGFINRIIRNFVNHAETSINNCTANFIEKCKEENLSKTIIEKNACVYRKTLINKFISRISKKKYKNDKLPNKFRINANNIKLLNAINEPYVSDGSVSLGDFIKSLLEEYSELPKHQRELIFFSETIDSINSAIKNNNALRTTVFTANKPGKVLFLLRPYKIINDSLRSKNYLVSISQSWDEKNSCWSSEKKVSSIRISRILSTSIQSTSSCFISKDIKEKIDNDINLKGIEFLLGDIKDIKVKFDNEGLKMLKAINYLKPRYYEKNSQNVYIFKCTEYQAKLYFSRFMGHSQILSPKELNDEIINEYKEAIKLKI